MKKFNITVGVVWLILFGLSLRDTPNDMNYWSATDNFIASFNDQVWELCHSCTITEENIPLSDAKYTGIILQNTFGGFCFFMLAINFFFHAGRGNVSRIGKAGLVPVRRLATSLHKIRVKKDTYLRRASSLGTDDNT